MLPHVSEDLTFTHAEITAKANDLSKMGYLPSAFQTLPGKSTYRSPARGAKENAWAIYALVHVREHNGTMRETYGKT